MGFAVAVAVVRYPDDKYDRFWEAYINISLWTEISTNSTINNLVIDYFEAPYAVMQTAVTPANSRNLDYSWKFDPGDLGELLAVLYFSEFLTLPGNMSRQFYIYLNNFLWYDQPFATDRLLNNYVYGLNPITGYQQYNVSLQALSNSTLPPILNAMEILTRMGNSNVATDSEDGKLFPLLSFPLEDKVMFFDCDVFITVVMMHLRLFNCQRCFTFWILC